MPRVHVDASVFTTTKAFGMVSGSIDLPLTPQVGDTLSFGMRGQSAVAGFQLLRVENRVIDADGTALVSLSLEDITVGTDDEALQVIKFFEQVHGLIGDVWEADPSPNA